MSYPKNPLVIPDERLFWTEAQWREEIKSDGGIIVNDLSNANTPCGRTHNAMRNEGLLILQAITPTPGAPSIMNWHYRYQKRDSTP